MLLLDSRKDSPYIGAGDPEEMLDEAFAHLRSGGLDAYERMLASEDAEEGPRAFTEGRDPHWQGR